MLKRAKKEIKSHGLIYFLLSALLLASLFVRIYRTEIILQFFFDMGRDAIQIWEFLYKGDVFLIGPTTGIAGIFRGPYYYYLIAPVYWLANGNPVWPANFLAFTTIAASALLYYLVYKSTHSRYAGLIAVILSGFSFHLMRAARWLSNPTPMMLLSMLFVFSIFLILNRVKWSWVLLSLIAGLSLFHFGSSGELFYYPTIFVLAFIYRKDFRDKRVLIGSVLAFLFSILPLVIFDLKNDYLLSTNIKNFMFAGDTFKASFAEIFTERLNLYRGVYWGHMFPSSGRWASFFGLSLLFLGILHLPKLIKNKYFIITGLILLMPSVGLMFFQGNAVYGYYLTGYYYIFILFISIIFWQINKIFFGKLYILAFIGLFLSQNLPIIRSNIMDNVDGPATIALKPQKQAVEWIYSNAGGAEFNVDVYVPPVIPYAYDYLFLWYENNLGYDGQIEEHTDLLYTLYEEDPPHPERLEAWLARQAGIGEVEYEEKYAGITVQRRKRLKSE